MPAVATGPAARSRPTPRRPSHSRGRRRGATASSAAIIQSGQAWPGGTSFWPEPADPALDVGGACPGARGPRPRAAPRRRASSDVARGRGHGHHEPGGLQGPAGQPAVGEVGQRVGAEQHQGGPPVAPPAWSPAAAARMPAVSRPRRSGTEPQAAVNQPAAGLEGDPARAGPRGQSHVEGAEHVAPPQRRQEAGLGQGRGQALRAASATSSPSSASDGRPTTTTTPARRAGPAGGPRPARRPSTAPGAGAPAPATRALDQGGGVARPRSAATRRRSAVSAWPAGDSSTSAGRRRPRPTAGGGRGPAAPRGRRRPAGSTVRGRSGLVDGGPGQAEHESPPAGRRPAGRRPSRCRARPWPAWPRRRRPRWSAGPRRSPPTDVRARRPAARPRGVAARPTALEASCHGRPPPGSPSLRTIGLGEPVLAC